MSLRHAGRTGLRLLQACDQQCHWSSPSFRNVEPKDLFCSLCCFRGFAKLPYESDTLSKVTLRDGSKLPPPPPPKFTRPSILEPEKVDESDMMRQAAQAVTDSMLPWERRQMDGGAKGMNSWERFYWGAFASAIVFLLGLQVYKSFEKPPPKVDESKEKRKEDMGRKLACGDVNILECEDLFEGMTPEDITVFAQQARTRENDRLRAESDVYDGLTPDEINALAAQSSQAA